MTARARPASCVLTRGSLSSASAASSAGERCRVARLASPTARPRSRSRGSGVIRRQRAERGADGAAHAVVEADRLEGGRRRRDRPRRWSRVDRLAAGARRDEDRLVGGGAEAAVGERFEDRGGARVAGRAIASMPAAVSSKLSLATTSARPGGRSRRPHAAARIRLARIATAISVGDQDGRHECSRSQ